MIYFRNDTFRFLGSKILTAIGTEGATRTMLDGAGVFVLVTLVPGS